MLRNIWSRVVHNYQEVRQAGDLDQVRYFEYRRREAEQGFETRVVTPVASYHASFAMTYKVNLSPERAREVIAECDEGLAAVKMRMEQRREKYGLKM